MKWIKELPVEYDVKGIEMAFLSNLLEKNHDGTFFTSKKLPDLSI